MYALDTNTLIYSFKGIGQVARKLLAQPPSEIQIPTVVAYEIETGIAKSARAEARRRQFDQMLDVVHLVPFDHPRRVRLPACAPFWNAGGRPLARSIRRLPAPRLRVARRWSPTIPANSVRSKA